MSGGLNLKSEVLNSSICTLCGACLDFCPYLMNKEDHLVMRFDCNVNEGRCYKVCPRTYTDWQQIKNKLFNDSYETLEIGTYVEIYKVKSIKRIDQQQDGGTVSTLLKTAIENNLADASLLTGHNNEIDPLPIIGEGIEAIYNSAGSKFLATPSLRKLINAQQEGIEKLAIVGRPCQLQALRKMQYSDVEVKMPSKIISIGLFCMWSLSWSFKDLLQEELPGEKILSLAIPQQGMEVKTDKGIKNIDINKVKDYVRPACNYCWDMTSELADISVGAFEPEKGWNTVIIRTDSGKQLLNLAQEKGYLEVLEYPNDVLEALKQASINKKLRCIKVLQDVFNNGAIKAFIDLENPYYKELLELAEGKVNA